MRIRPIHHTFGPHISRQFALKADALLLSPWKWNKKENIESLRDDIQNCLGGSAHLFASGREGLLALLRSLNYEQGSEIIIQGYTCVAVPNAVHTAGYTPVYVDINRETLNIDLSSLQGRINNRTRAIICQHTFGIPANTTQLREVCRQHNLVLIEDCAHIIPDTDGPQSIGRDGDYLMLSFGRDKALSGIAGGAIIDRNKTITELLSSEEERAEQIGTIQTLKLMLYAPIYHKTRFVYGLFGIGKALLLLCSKLGLLVSVLSKQEKKGTMPNIVRRMPEPCAALLRSQWPKLKEINDHRRALTAQILRSAQQRGWSFPQEIRENLPLQKFPIFIENPDDVRSTLKKRSIYLDDGWTGAVVCPRTVNQEATNYIAGSCPHAEQVARSILSLPTHPTATEKQTKALIQSLSSLLG